MEVFRNPGSSAFALSENTEYADGEDPICIRHGARVVSGLPVANGGSHSINALRFTPEGDLLIAVGGSTNMGLPGFRLGNLWESPLSGALVIAKMSRGRAFDGTVRYADAFRIQNGTRVPAPDTARVVSGDVEVWASGFRNLYTITQTLSGDWFAVDQGPGCPLGGPSVSCADYDAAATAAWPVIPEEGAEPVDWASQVIGSEPTCPGIRREDELLPLRRGAFYGHANIQRGGRECAWIDPLTGRTADGKSAPDNYIGPLAMIPSSATAVAEYGASHFCGAMRGDLVCLLYTSPSPRDQRGSRMPSYA